MTYCLIYMAHSNRSPVTYDTPLTYKLCVHTCTCAHTYVYTCTHAHMHTHTHMHTRTHTHTHTGLQLASWSPEMLPQGAKCLAELVREAQLSNKLMLSSENSVRIDQPFLFIQGLSLSLASVFPYTKPLDYLT